MVKFVQDFSKDLEQGLTDGRLDAPAVHRNSEVILEVLTENLADKSGHVVEIGCGTGQHALVFASAFPDLTWWPTDLQESHIVSTNAWRDHRGVENIRDAVLLDASQHWNVVEHDEFPVEDVTAIYTANVIHISPWEVAQGILASASRHLSDDGVLIFYGPFARNGDMLSEGNVAFNNALQGKDPSWGIRDVVDIEEEAATHKLKLSRLYDMPSNNSMLLLGRD